MDQGREALVGLVVPRGHTLVSPSEIAQCGSIGGPPHGSEYGTPTIETTYGLSTRPNPPGTLYCATKWSPSVFQLNSSDGAAYRVDMRVSGPGSITWMIETVQFIS